MILSEGKKFVLFRADASLRIGSGHVMRCLTLAEELRRKGADCRFLCRVRPGHLIGFIQEKGFLVYSMQSPEKEHDLFSLGGDIREEIEMIESMVLEKKTDISNTLIVDHYSIDIEYEKGMRPYFDRIMAIDDLANREHDCDILLDQNYSTDENRYQGLVPSSCKRLLGPQFALLRKEFTGKITLSEKSFNPRKVLIFFGGSDPENFLQHAIEIIKTSGEYEPEVVVGRQHPALDVVARLVELMPGASLHIQTNEMSSIMKKCSWFLGAGGSITWERFVFGLPGVVIPIAENQRRIAQELHEAGFQTIVEGDDWPEKLRGLLNDLPVANLQRQRERMKELSVGSKTPIVGSLLLGDFRDLVLRSAQAGDARQYFVWANSREVRESSFNSNPIEWENHLSWFAEKIRSEFSFLFLMSLYEVPVGQIRFDQLASDQWTIDYTVDPVFRRCGLGPVLLDRGAEELINHTSGRQILLVASVKNTNIASMKAFLKAHYSITEQIGGTVRFEKLIRRGTF